MYIHISKSSKAAGLLKIVCVMLLICLLLSACGKKEENNTGNDAAEPAVTDAVSADPQEDEPEATPGAWDLAFSTGTAGLEEISLWPDDFTGFTIGFAPGNKDALFAAATPVRTDEYGVEYFKTFRYSLYRENHSHTTPTVQAVKRGQGVHRRIIRAENEFAHKFRKRAAARKLFGAQSHNRRERQKDYARNNICRGNSGAVPPVYLPIHKHYRYKAYRPLNIRQKVYVNKSRHKRHFAIQCGCNIVGGAQKRSGDKRRHKIC